MEEGSSIAKAIEQAWLRAGQPEEFTVKVFEEPKKNFFGLTTQPAKIAILFSQHASKVQKNIQGRPQKTEPRRREQPQTQKPVPAQKKVHPAPKKDDRRQQPRQPQRPRQLERRTPDQRPRQPLQQPEAPHSTRQQESPWSPEMVQAAREWIQETLVMMGKKDITFSTDVNRIYLNVRFNEAILKGADQEMLFKSWSNLIMQSLRDTFKKDIRNFRVSFNGR